MRYNLPPAAQRLVDDAFLHAHQQAQARSRPAPPVSLFGLDYGETFILDSAPTQLLVRVRDDMPIGNVIPVVIIAASGHGSAQVGKVFGLAPETSVRVVDVIAPCKVRAR